MARVSDPAYELYKKARNRISTLQPISLIGMAVTALHKVALTGTDAMATYQPWNLLLLIKWTAQEADATSHRRDAIATDLDLFFCLNILTEIENAVKMPLDYAHPTLFLRKLAFQQFGLQQGADGSALAQQLSLFRELPDNHWMQTEFRTITGVSINEFCVLSCGLLLLAMNKPEPIAINPQHLLPLESATEPDSVARFVRFLSRTLPELHEWFNREEFRGKAIADQRILPSPLVDTPLLAIDPFNFAIYYLPLLIRSLERGVYRTLRQKDSSAFGNDFGPLFEKYIKRCLDCAGVKYLEEKTLQTLLPGQGECIDFLIVENDSTVLIDTKAVEMSPLGRLSHEAEQLTKALSAAIKAMGQGMATCQRIDKRPIDAQPPLKGKETFLMIVTFDDLYLGSPHDFRAIFGDTILPRLEEKYRPPLPIPFENMFILSISELEELLELIRTGQTTLVAALRHARKEDEDYRTKKFRFKQHLDALGTLITRLPLAQEAIARLAKEASRRFQSASKPR